MKIDVLIMVPARSGSKGIADKNIKPLAGRPLLAWTTEAIRLAGLKNAVAILTTDSEDYARLGRVLGLNVPFIRPEEYSGDAASALAVVHHALQWFFCDYGYYPESSMWLQPTSPFRSAAIIRQAMDMMTEQGADAVIGCKPIHRDLTTLFSDESGFLSPLSQDKPTQTTRQQVRPLLTPNGAMYLCKTAHLLEKQSFYPEKTLPLVMNAVQSLDIDTEEDWAMAEAFIKQGLV